MRKRKADEEADDSERLRKERGEEMESRKRKAEDEADDSERLQRAGDVHVELDQKMDVPPWIFEHKWKRVPWKFRHKRR